RLLGAWAGFRGDTAALSAGATSGGAAGGTEAGARAPAPRAPDPGTTPTREKWLLPLFQELGYGRLPTAKAHEIDGRIYAISHGWGHVPIHLVGLNVDLDRRTPGVAGAAQASPHSLLQEFLNRSDEHLWGFVSNGLSLRILRDNRSLTRQAFVEFDLEAMMTGEAYADFALLYLLCHQSRVESERPEECWLERWSRAAEAQGTRALDQLRKGVEETINALGTGFIAHPGNTELRQKLQDGTLSTQDYYRDLLRLVYRLLFVFVAEDRGLLLDPGASAEAKALYTRFYSSARLRRLAERRRGSRHADLYRGLRLVLGRLGDDRGCPELALPALGSFLFSDAGPAALGSLEIANRDLLAAVRGLAFTTDGKIRRAVDYRNLGSEELGSVYEALLELHPEVNVPARAFGLASAGGSERKTTGSYYTPTSLIQCLLDSALEPVVADALSAPDPEAALLALRVCDPACGSGHFLVAAAHRLAKHLAAARTGDEEPSPEAQRTALRDVIGHCLYGVDLNPMAVELCKVSLWMEALEPGKPLSFLDHRILSGNSLLGATPALLAAGVPDEAFKAIEGDDKQVVSELRKSNKRERAGQTTLFASTLPALDTAALAETVAGIDHLADDSMAGVHAKEERYRGLAASAEFRRAKLFADAWCAAFVCRKSPGDPTAVTHDVFLRLAEDPESVPTPIRDEVERLADEYRLFHWHLAFPDVFWTSGREARAENEQAGWSGGFDVVLGNPPWERIKLQEQEFFAIRHPGIADAPNAAARRRIIDRLVEEDAPLHAAFLAARRQAEGESHLIRNSGRYPLCGRGDVNTYTVFAETKRTILGPTGRVGTIVPSGIATDDTTKFFFQDLMDGGSLVSLYDFQSGSGLFAEIGHARFKYCLLTMTGSANPSVEGAEFVFFARSVSDLHDGRRFTLSAADIALLNPNTRTCPVFRTRRDAEITKAIYRRVPVLVREGPPEENPWRVSFLTMFHMSNDSHLFRTSAELEGEGWRLEGNMFVRGGERYLPLYEAKMIHHFDHRFGDYRDKLPGSEGTALPCVSLERLADPSYEVHTRYWVRNAEVGDRLRGRWERGWLLGWRDICRSTDERTVIAGLVPRVGVGNNLPLMMPEDRDGPTAACLLASLSSFACDYAARSKVGGTHLNFFIYEQLPVLPPSTYSACAAWSLDETVADWMLPRVLELVYTSWALESFARDCGFSCPPFVWDDERRLQLRCELDAAFFHLYGLERDDVEYVMDTFPIVRRKDEAQFGEYRTKRVVIGEYDHLARLQCGFGNDCLMH
ncbi:MAG: Eco57I restriction-modification methylase domain-containing protein, partial [Thermoleophilia bacterium]